MIEQHFVTFYSPGTFVAEETRKPIESWDVAQAVAMAGEIQERNGATPYGFQFTTRGRGEHELDSHQTAPKDAILRSNMRANGWDKVVRNSNSWTWEQPLRDGDVVLEYP